MDEGDRVARAWLVLAGAIGVHVTDEALNGFLPIWNATVRAVHEGAPWFPMPSFTFRMWLGGLMAGVCLMIAVTPWMARQSRWARRVAWLLAVIMVGNAIGHTLGTLYGQTVNSVVFARPMPGFWSSPLLLGAAVLLVKQLRQQSDLVA